MTAVDRYPVGAPCWTDLWTSDVEGSRTFYGELFGWEADEPNEEFGGYFMFHHDGAPVAGAMGDMGPDLPADDSWKIYLSTDDIAGVHAALPGRGGMAFMAPDAVADLGSNLVFLDPEGARLGAWQPETFPGFNVLGEHGAPGWFELFTRDFTGALDFYRSVFSWQVEIEGDTDEFRYATVRHPDRPEEQIAGVMDASAFLPEGVPAHWSIYWQVDDIDATVARLLDLGGSVVDGPTDTPYGRMGTVTDPSGAQFKLLTPPA